MHEELRRDLFSHIEPQGIQRCELRMEPAKETLEHVEERIVGWGIPEDKHTKEINLGSKEISKEVKIGVELNQEEEVDLTKLLEEYKDVLHGITLN